MYKNSYSQNKEQDYILHYFRNSKPLHLLDIGANDGQTFSNSRALIEYKEWSGLLVEPSQTAFKKLNALYINNNLVECLNVAVGTVKGKIDFYDMGDHVGKGDTSLLATTEKNELARWKDTPFTKTKCKCVTYAEIEDSYDFITIDAEGLDYDILKQINLKDTQMVCLEWNSNPGTLALFRAYVPVEMKELYRNCENVIYAR